MIHTWTITAHGQPQAKGSTRAFLPKGSRFPVVTSTNRNLKSWEQTVKHAAQEQSAKPAGWRVDVPMSVSIVVILPRPKALGKKQTRHAKRPDLDKLARAVIDALTGVVWNDDAQVDAIFATKRYAAINEGTQCTIEVSQKEE